MNASQPHETAVNTLTITCAQNGTTEDYETGSDVECATVADLEAFCADIRQRGGSGDVAVPAALDLSVTLDMR